VGKNVGGKGRVRSCRKKGGKVNLSPRKQEWIRVESDPPKNAGVGEGKNWAKKGL